MGVGRPGTWVLEGWRDWEAGRGQRAGGQTCSRPATPHPHPFLLLPDAPRPSFSGRHLLWRMSTSLPDSELALPPGGPRKVLLVITLASPFCHCPAAAPLHARADASLASPAGLSRPALPPAAAPFAGRGGSFLHKNSNYCHLRLCWPIPNNREVSLSL